MRCRKLNLLRICHGLGSELTVSPVPRWSLRPALAHRGARPLRSQYPLAASPLSRHPWPAGSLTYPHRRPGLCSRSGKRGSVRTASQSLSFRDNATLCAGECLQVELASYWRFVFGRRVAPLRHRATERFRTEFFGCSVASLGGIQSRYVSESQRLTSTRTHVNASRLTQGNELPRGDGLDLQRRVRHHAR